MVCGRCEVNTIDDVATQFHYYKVDTMIRHTKKTLHLQKKNNIMISET